MTTATITQTRPAPSTEELEKLTTLTLPDLIRAGCTVTTQAVGWGEGEKACTLTAAALALEALDAR